MQVNPSDAERLGLAEGGDAAVSSRAGELVVPIEVTDSIMEGVVSIPHGWGHDAEGARLEVAGRAPGVNSNLLVRRSARRRPLRERRAQRHPGGGGTRPGAIAGAGRAGSGAQPPRLNL